jgi:predicted TPR repeat methyltransferase
MKSSIIEYHNKFAIIHDEEYLTGQRYTDRYHILRSLIEKYFKVEEVILDLGCGSGIFAEIIALRSSNVIAVDGSDKMLELFAQRLNESSLINRVKTIKGIIPEVLENRTISSVNGIFASSIVEYIPNLTVLASTLYNKLSEDGYFIVTMPNASSILRRFQWLSYLVIKRPRYYRYIVNYLSENSMMELLISSGFKIIECQYFSIPKPFNILVNILNKKKISNMYVIVCQKNS